MIKQHPFLCFNEWMDVIIIDFTTAEFKTTLFEQSSRKEEISMRIV